jgi:RimJ/RimL family protein N-acetyltransferase
MSTIDRQSVTYRPIREDDRPFLAALYASTRADEMQVVPWTEEQKAQFLAMQFHAQTVYYAEHYNVEDFFIIEHDGRAIGRLYLDHQPEDVCIVDIALLPEVRGGGLGTVLLQEILDDAAGKEKTVSIHVEHFNPAKRLYQRFGFEEKGTNGVYHHMIWTPPAK